MTFRQLTLGHLLVIVFSAAFVLAFPSLSYAQGKIVFTSYRDGDSEIFIMNGDGTGLTQLTFNNVTDEHPALSPDGNKIVFTSYRDIAPPEIYTMNADGSNVFRVTTNTTSDSYPSFGPGGKIVFSSARAGNTSQIYSMDSNGQNVGRLTDNLANDLLPRFSPDGSKIVFTSDRGGPPDKQQVYIMDANGGNEVNLSQTTGFDHSGAFSPDGTKIVFISDRDGTSQVYVMNSSGGAVTRLTNTTFGHIAPYFSPDGTKITFASARETAPLREVYTMNADGTGGVTRLTTDPYDDTGTFWGIQGNMAPTITAAIGVTRERGAAAANSTIATVTDAEDAEDTLSVQVNGGSTAIVNGVEVSGISVSSSGIVTADISATCGASDASFTLRVTDSGNLFSIATLNVAVTNETVAPVLTLPADIVVSLPLNSTSTSMVVNFAVSATDNCDPNPTVVASPASGSTFQVGTTTVNVTATDATGNVANGSFTVTVAYNFTGFFQPVDNLPVVNVVSAGQAIPVKFSLSGYKGLNIFAADYPASIQVACEGGSTVSTVEETVTAGQSSLTYEAGTDRYHYVWKTDKAWRGTCRQLIVKLNDGSLHVANFQFR